MYRYQGKQQEITLGKYPALTLAQTRLKNHKIRAQLVQGIDPKEIAKQAFYFHHLQLLFGLTHSPIHLITLSHTIVDCPIYCIVWVGIVVVGFTIIACVLDWHYFLL